jgi:hypothetical protein
LAFNLFDLFRVKTSSVSRISSRRSMIRSCMSPIWVAVRLSPRVRFIWAFNLNANV